MIVTNQLGQPTPSSTLDAIGSYVAGLRDSVASAKKNAINAYNTLKQVRSNLGLPFMAAASGESGADSNGWTPDLEQQAVDVTAMANLLVAAADDVLAGKRKLFWDDQLKNFAIEGFQSDVLRIQLDANGVPVLVDASGQQQHITGQVGIAPVVVFGVVAGLVLVQALLIFLLVKQALETLQVVSEQKTQRTLAEAAKKHADLVKDGKATPEQAEKLNKSMYDGAVELQKEQNAPKTKPDEWPQTLRTLGYIALGVGILYVIVQLVPKPGSGGAMALARSNPRREPADEDAADELELYLENDDRFAIHGHGQGQAISQNLWRKWKKGTYDSARAPQAWSYVVESAAKAYAKEFDSPSNWSRTFSPATRDMVARSLAKRWEDEARGGEFDRYPPAA